MCCGSYSRYLCAWRLGAICYTYLMLSNFSGRRAGVSAGRFVYSSYVRTSSKFFVLFFVMRHSVGSPAAGLCKANRITIIYPVELVCFPTSSRDRTTEILFSRCDACVSQVGMSVAIMVQGLRMDAGDPMLWV